MNWSSPRNDRLTLWCLIDTRCLAVNWYRKRIWVVSHLICTFLLNLKCKLVLVLMQGIVIWKIFLGFKELENLFYLNLFSKIIKILNLLLLFLLFLLIWNKFEWVFSCLFGYECFVSKSCMTYLIKCWSTQQAVENTQI